MGFFSYNPVKFFTMEKHPLTAKVARLRGIKFTDEELSELIGISRPTLYVRLEKSNWKKGELELIKKINE